MPRGATVPPCSFSIALCPVPSLAPPAWAGNWAWERAWPQFFSALPPNA